VQASSPVRQAGTASYAPPRRWRAWELTADAAEVLNAQVVVVQTPPNMPADSQSIMNAEQFSGTILGDTSRTATSGRFKAIWLTGHTKL